MQTRTRIKEINEEYIMRYVHLQYTVYVVYVYVSAFVSSLHHRISSIPIPTVVAAFYFQLWLQ